MKQTLKNLGVLLIGPIVLALIWDTSAQSESKSQTQTDSFNTKTYTVLPNGIHVRYANPDSIKKWRPNTSRNLLLTPKDKKRYHFRDLLLRPQDRNAIMVHPVQDTLAQPDSTKQEK